MSNERCKTCLFGDKCVSLEDCDYYAPLDEDSEMDRYMELGRVEFHDAWIQYTSGW